MFTALKIAEITALAVMCFVLTRYGRWLDKKLFPLFVNDGLVSEFCAGIFIRVFAPIAICMAGCAVFWLLYRLIVLNWQWAGGLVG